MKWSWYDTAPAATDNGPYFENACTRVPDQNVCVTSRSMWERSIQALQYAQQYFKNSLRRQISFVLLPLATEKAINKDKEVFLVQ